MELIVSKPLPPKSRPLRKAWFTRSAATIAAMATMAVLANACSSKKNPKDDPRLLVIDGIEITFAELQPYFDWLKSYRPELGVKTTYIWTLRDHFLPLKVAQREFPAERQKQLELAQGLTSVSSNIYELEEQSKLINHKSRSNLTRQSAILPVAMWLFDDLHTNAVSRPIELAQGYFVVGSYEFHHSPMAMTEYVDALQVGFVTHTNKKWHAWWENKQLTLGKKVTFVHPDYRDDLPEWMDLPKKNTP
jgi:hypothetical protein